VVKILVTNTMENARAVENHAGKLQKIQVNGLLGPVKVLPYLETTIRCSCR